MSRRPWGSRAWAGVADGLVQGYELGFRVRVRVSRRPWGSRACAGVIHALWRERVRVYGWGVQLYLFLRRQDGTLHNHIHLDNMPDS